MGTAIGKFAADGYARVTGRPSVCIMTSGPAMLNAATALGQAYSDWEKMDAHLTVPSHPPILEALRRHDAEGMRTALDEHFEVFLGDERCAAFKARPFRDAGIETLRRLKGGGDGVGAVQ